MSGTLLNSFIQYPVAAGGPVDIADASMVAYYELNEASGDRVDLHGSITMVDTNTVTSAAGKQGNAALFTSANAEYLNASTGTGLRPRDQDWCCWGWVYATTLPGTFPTIFSACSGGTVGYSLLYNHSSARFEFYVNSGVANYYAQASTFGAPSAGTWYFIYAEYNDATNTIGISINDGAKDTASGPGASINTSDYPVMLGAHYLLGRYWNGRIDEFGISNRLLTADEITFLYNSGSGRTYLELSSGWLPTDLDNLPGADPQTLQIWQHWQDNTGLWQDVGRSTPVTTSGQTIGHSDNRFTYSPGTEDWGSGLKVATTSDEPPWIDGAAQSPQVSGGWIRTDNTDHLHTPSTFAMGTDPDCLWGYAFKHGSWGAGNLGIASFGTTNIDSTPVWLITYNGTNMRFYIDGGYVTAWDFAPTNNQYYYIVMRITNAAGIGSNRLVDLWINGTKQTQHNAGTVITGEGTAAYHFIGSGYPTTTGPDRFYGAVIARNNAGLTSPTGSVVFHEGMAVRLSNYLAGLEEA